MSKENQQQAQLLEDILFGIDTSGWDSGVKLDTQQPVSTVPTQLENQFETKVTQLSDEQADKILFDIFFN